jgi:hypothetical protein
LSVDLPAALRLSPLLRSGGFHLARAWPGHRLVKALLDEASEALAHARENRVDASDGEEGRGGSPRRRFLSAPGGECQSALFGDPDLRRHLSELMGVPLRPSGLAGTYSYYTRPGDFLTIHRDVVTCDLALITCLQDSGAKGHSGASCLWPGRRDEPMSTLRANPGPGGQVLHLEPGDTMVLLGGIVPHAVLPVAPGQRRVVSLLCFEAAVSPPPG